MDLPEKSVYLIKQDFIDSKKFIQKIYNIIICFSNIKQCTLVEFNSMLEIIYLVGETEHPTNLKLF
tara:strand:- start:622 stop:819 length:198 start_codon:yes stop_codon:yes gene_type:complete